MALLMARRSMTPREGTAYECDHLRQVARNMETDQWHHVDGGVIGAVCTSGPYRVDFTFEGEHYLSDLWINP